MLLTAAMVAAGALSSVAQNVYSVNVVGYINLTLKPGYNLISVPLTGNPDNSVNTVLTNTTPTIPDGGNLYTWDPVGQTYAQALNSSGGQWVDGSFNLSSQQVVPGQSFFIQNVGGSPVTLTLVGTVPQGTNHISLHSAYSFVADPAPISGDVTTNGFPVADNSLVYTWDNIGQTYNQALTGSGGQFVDGSFNTVVLAPPVGGGFIYFNPNATTSWTRTFTVQ